MKSGVREIIVKHPAGNRPTPGEVELIRAIVKGLDHDSVRVLGDAVEAYALVLGHFDDHTALLDPQAGASADRRRLQRLGALLYRANATRDFLEGES